MNDLHSLLNAQDGAADVVNIKISKFRGITKARQALELCSKLGLAATVEDLGAETLPLRPSSILVPQRPLQAVLTVTDSTASLQHGAPGTNHRGREEGRQDEVAQGPGLGVRPNMDVPRGSQSFVIQ